MTEVQPTAGDDTRRHLTHVARGGALGLVGAGVSAIAGFVLVVIVTNRYPAHDAGLFFTVTSAFLLMSALTSLGVETGLGRFLLRYEAQGRRGDIPPTIRAAMRPTLIYTVLLAIGIIVFAAPLSNLIGLDGPDGAASVRVLAVVLPLSTWSTLTLAGTRAFGRMRATVMVDKIGRPLAQPILVMAVSLAAADLLGLTVAYAVPYAVAALVSSWMFRSFVARRHYENDQPTRPYRELKRDFWRFTWPRSITRISQMAIQRMDIILIAAMRSPKEAAIYTAATRFVALGQFGTQATQQVLQPKFTALLANHEMDSLRDVYQISSAWNMVVAWPMYVGVASAPLVYLGLFGHDYKENGVAVVLLMSVAMLFAVATGPADTLLLMSGRSALSLINSLSALAIDMGLCVALIPGMGITGAALAWAIAVIARSTLSVIQVRLTLHIISFGPAAFIAGLANVLCFGLPLLGVSLFIHLNIWTLLLTLLFCFPLYAGALWLGRRVLMLDVLRGLVRRRRQPVSPEGDEVTEEVEVDPEALPDA